MLSAPSSGIAERMETFMPYDLLSEGGGLFATITPCVATPIASRFGTHLEGLGIITRGRY
jgi:hypothetical protein